MPYALQKMCLVWIILKTRRIIRLEFFVGCVHVANNSKTANIKQPNVPTSSETLLLEIGNKVIK
jgi:hypothetical protein